jgi:hypothetical protein
VENTSRVGSSYIPSQVVHIGRVATQGFLYVATFFISYTPQFTIRILGSIAYNYSRNTISTVFWSSTHYCFPCKDFARPNFLRLKSAGASNWMAMRGSCLEPDISRFLSQTMGIPSSHSAVASSGLESGQEANRRESLEPSGKFEVLSDEGSTDDERDSSEYDQLPKIRNAATRAKQTSSILKMDGSITCSEVRKV